MASATPMMALVVVMFCSAFVAMAAFGAFVVLNKPKPTPGPGTTVTTTTEGTPTPKEKRARYEEAAEKCRNKAVLKPEMSAIDFALRLEKDGLALLEHLKTKYATHSVTQAIDGSWSRRVVVRDMAYAPSDGSRAAYQKATGCLMVDAGNDADYSEWRSVLCHEMAHAAGVEHDETWRQAFMFLLKVATKDLKWDVKLFCKTTCPRYKVCIPRDCPACTCRS